MAKGASAPAAERRRAREAERRAHDAAQAAQRLAGTVSPDRDIEGDVATCAQEAHEAWHRCREHVRKCDEAASVPSYADRYERRDAAKDAAQYARLAERAADAAEEYAQSAAHAAARLEAGDAEMAAMGADWGTTFRGWSSRRR
jgi:hypothetical protein